MKSSAQEITTHIAQLLNGFDSTDCYDAMCGMFVTMICSDCETIGDAKLMVNELRDFLNSEIDKHWDVYAEQMRDR